MRQLGNCSQPSNLEIEEENFTVTLDYDWQTQRVMVQLKFIYEGCYHATIKYKSTELHNGDFDIIVLNSTFPFLKFFTLQFIDFYLLQVLIQLWFIKTLHRKIIMFVMNRN